MCGQTIGKVILKIVIVSWVSAIRQEPFGRLGARDSVEKWTKFQCLDAGCQDTHLKFCDLGQ